MPGNSVSTQKPPMIAIAQITETRAALAVGTVKNRSRMCGSPAMPRNDAADG